MKTVTVIPLKKGIWKEDLTYFTAKDVTVGSIVTIPFRKKNILGLVISVEDVSGDKMNIKDLNFNLRKVINVKENSIFQTEFLESAIAVSKYFVANKNVGVPLLIPSVFIENYDKIALSLKNWSGRQANTDAAKIRTEKLLLQLPLSERISIYKTLIRENFSLKKSVFIVLPTERDIDTFFETLAKGIEQFTFKMHSGLSTKKTLTLIKDASNSTHPVLILGTAPYLITPRTDTGVIILEHESSSAYRTIARPQMDLRIFVETYAAKIKAKFIMSDTLLRFETLARRDTDNLQSMHPVSFRIDFGGQIEIEKPVSLEDKKFTVLSGKTIEEIKHHTDHKRNVFIFSLRKGLSTMTVCRDCSTMVGCPTCGSPVVLYLSKDETKRILSCNKCKVEIDPDTTCTNCGGWNLTGLGIGTDTVVEYLKDQSSQTEKIKVLKLDKEVAKSSSGAEKIIEDFEQSQGAVIVGTEMAFFYMKNKVSLSVISSFDSLWSIPNFKMSEKILQIIISILEKTENKLIIQTKNEKDSALLAIKNGNLLSFVREEIEDRKKLEYPPFKRFIKITYLGDKEKTERTREYLSEFSKEYNPEIFSGFHTKFKDKYITNTLIKLNTKDWSLPDLSLGSNVQNSLHSKLASLPNSFLISVDPEDLL